jgi:sodium/hydrogen exchanger-like protein 6/7
MMLFWVGVGLTAGFHGTNAQMSRMTVLVVVVLTVVMFGGTTARMLEVLGIRTGVEDDAASSDDDDEPLPTRRGGGSVRWQRLPDDPHQLNMYRTQSPRSYNHHVQSLSRSRSGSPLDSHPPHHLASAGHGSSSSIATLGRSHCRQISPVRSGDLFSAASSDSYDSDSGGVLPLASSAGASAEGGRSGGRTDGRCSTLAERMVT